MNPRMTLLLAALWLALAGPAAAETLRVLTSYPPEMVELYQQAFARVRPDLTLEVEYDHGGGALKTLRSPDQGGIDVWWAPAANAFPVLAREGGLQKLPGLEAGIETSLRGVALGDPARGLLPFELAGYGLALRADRLAARGLPTPARWDDLAKPIYAGQIALPVPSAIGYAPPMLETLLQERGWEQGWATWAEIAANATLVDAGGGVAVLNELLDGDRSIALTMDFFVRPLRKEGKPLTFAYPAPTLLSPAHVGIPVKAPHPEAARALVAFLLSDQGQTLLFDPAVSRLPVRRAVYAQAPADVARPFDPQAAGGRFDPALASARQAAVTALFDEWIAVRHAKLQTLFAAIHAAEAKGDRGRAALARAALAHPPLTAAAAADPALNALLRNPDSAEAKAIRAGWRNEADQTIEHAFAALH